MLALALLLQTLTTPATAPASPQGQEVVDLFAGMCVEEALNSAKAHRFDSQPGIARPMTPDELTRVMPGGVATEGWITKSPHDAWAALWFAPSKRTCGVTVRAADPAGIEAALDTRLRAFYSAMTPQSAQLKSQITQRPDETIQEGGVTVHRASWIIDLGPHQLAVIASIGDKPIGAKQHLMTFTMLR